MTDTTLSVQSGSLAVTSMRYHELALQAWLNAKFFVRAGYPVPVIFSSPMDAFTRFQDLWKRDKNPFSYLFDLKDEKGTPLYEPHPAVPRYPLFSVMRKGWKYRQYQNYSIHQWRRMNWPTVSPDVKREDLGTATVSFMPMAWDYRFQVDYMSMRPDTQAFFIETMMRQFFRSGGALQTWIPINYPGIGTLLVRMTMEGDSLEWGTPDEPEQDKITEYRSTVTVTIEGYSIDVNYKFLPTLWTLIVGDAPADQAALASLNPILVDNLRVNNANPVMAERTNIPANGTNATLPSTFSQPFNQYILFGTGTPETADPEFVVQPAVSYGIISAEAFGIPTVNLV
jgi:hypothetical protein